MPVLCLGLASCATTVPVSPVPEPDAGKLEPSSASKSVEKYYARVEESLQARGLLRTDDGRVDARFTRRDLVEDFVQIALYDEYVASGGAIIARPTKSKLRRWEKPIRIGVTFGDRVPQSQRDVDLETVNDVAKQLGRASRHPVSVSTPNQANFHVLVLNEDDRRAIGPALNDLIPGIDDTLIRFLTNLSRSTYCLVFAFSEGDSPVYSKALAVVRSEHPDLLRQSCFHEEMAQGMGLANDSPRARPSVFNDDEEFALLTTHDELLLRILYDRRLRPGMTPEQARPIVERIVDELLGGSA